IRRADDVRTGVLRLLRLLALGEDRDAGFLAGPMREHQRAAELLVGVAHVEAEPEVHLDRLVELRRLHLLEQAHRPNRRVLLLAVERRAGVAIVLAVCAHRMSVSTPIDWAAPAMIRIAWSMSRAFRSGIFVSAI